MIQQKNRSLVSVFIFIVFGCLAVPKGERLAEEDIPREALVSLQQAVVSVPKARGTLVPCLMQTSLRGCLNLAELQQEDTSLLQKSAQWVHGLFHSDAQPITYTNKHDKPAVVIDESADVGDFMPVLIDRQRLIDKFNLKPDFPIDAAVLLLKSGEDAALAVGDEQARFHAKNEYQYEQKLSWSNGEISMPIYRALVSDKPRTVGGGIQTDESSLLQDDESGEESEEEEVEESVSPVRHRSLVEQGKLKLFQEQKPLWKRVRSTILSVGLPIYAAAVSVYVYGLQNDLSVAQNDATMAYGNATLANAQNDQVCEALYQDCINGNSPGLGAGYQEALNVGLSEGVCRIFNQLCNPMFR